MKHPDVHKVYLFLVFSVGFLIALGFGLSYETTAARLNPLQLMIIGAALSISRLVFEIPTGVVADLYSRRLSVLIGLALIGLAMLIEGLFPSFVPILLAQVIWGLGYTFTSGANEAWLSDEIGAFGWAPLLWMAVVLFLVIYSLGEVSDPLLLAWMNQRLDSDVRATILSMVGQAESVGQAVGGLLVGFLANLFTVPLAISLCGGLLIPALGFIRRAITLIDNKN